MITAHSSFQPEAWALRETKLDLDVLAQTESLFALSNGHIGLRGNLDEGEPSGLPGTYLNSFYEVTPLPSSEPAYGVPQAGQRIVNVTDGKIIRLLVRDEPFDVRYGELISHERVLDLRAGVLRRTVDWRSPAGARVQVKSTRLVSFAQRAIAAVLYEVTPVDASTRVVLESELLGNETLPVLDGDVRRGSADVARLQARLHRVKDLGALLVHSTAESELVMAAGMDHILDGPEDTETSSEATEDEARVMISTDLAAGECLRLVKVLGYGWSSRRTDQAVADQVRGAVLEARHTGWEGLLDAQREYLDDYWARADVEIDGDDRLQCAVRVSMFHCLQASARAEQRAIPAKGLTGTGYDGHTFWDTESFVLQLLTYTAPDAARDALRWRRDTLEEARAQAGQLCLGGAAFPWRTIRGQECSAYWPAGIVAFHINADIADAALRYGAAAHDPEFERDVAAELLFETARLWHSLGHESPDGHFRIDGVTGPDEYSAIADNNVYTNLMAQRNLRAAADVAERLPDRAKELGVGAPEAAARRADAQAMVVPFDAGLGVHSQADRFTALQRWDFAASPPSAYPLFLHYPYFDLYRKQVVKQADLVLAMHLRGDAFTDEQKARNFAYYEQLTVRDSSLSACTQAVLAAEIGHLDLAFDYFGEAALIDLDDIEHNTRDGLHLAALAGAWIVAVAGFGGMRDHDGELSFKPRLPTQLKRLGFGMLFRERGLRVVVSQESATYSLVSGGDLSISHHDEALTVAVGQPQTRPIPPPRPGMDTPTQPAGRAPAKREERG
jgi:alpha,alpha-trehalose phosphorylase